MDGAARLDAAFSINPEWASQISYFVSENPEFLPFLKYASFTPRSEIPEELKTIKDMLLYYVSFSGVRSSYGNQIYEWVKQRKLDKIGEKKRETIEKIIEHNEIATRKEFNDFAAKKIKGVGIGAITFVLEHFFHDEDITYPTNRTFQKGLSKIYNRSPLTVTQCKKIISTWKGNKTVGSSFCYQVAHYM